MENECTPVLLSESPQDDTIEVVIEVPEAFSRMAPFPDFSKLTASRARDWPVIVDMSIIKPHIMVSYFFKPQVGWMRAC
jgi:hypothetical protein